MTGEYSEYRGVKNSGFQGGREKAKKSKKLALDLISFACLSNNSIDNKEKGIYCCFVDYFCDKKLELKLRIYFWLFMIRKLNIFGISKMTTPELAGKLENLDFYWDGKKIGKTFIRAKYIKRKRKFFTVLQQFKFASI